MFLRFFLAVRTMYSQSPCAQTGSGIGGSEWESFPALYGASSAQLCPEVRSARERRTWPLRHQETNLKTSTLRRWYDYSQLSFAVQAKVYSQKYEIPKLGHCRLS